MDFSNFKLRCSSIGPVMSEPKSKAAKEAGELSITAKTHLKKVYAFERYGRKKDILTKQMNKGNVCEPDSIELLSLIDGKKYKKNKLTFANEYIQGTPDIIDHKVFDVKTSYEMDTFLAVEGEVLDSDYEDQIQGYMELTNIEEGEVVYCLVSSPESIVNGEIMRLAQKMDVLTIETPEFKIAEAELIKNMVFDDIDPEERIIRFQVKRNPVYMLKVYNKVIECRRWLQSYHELRIKLCKSKK